MLLESDRSDGGMIPKNTWVNFVHRHKDHGKLHCSFCYLVASGFVPSARSMKLIDSEIYDIICQCLESHIYYCNDIISPQARSGWIWLLSWYRRKAQEAHREPFEIVRRVKWRKLLEFGFFCRVRDLSEYFNGPDFLRRHPREF